MNFLEDITIDNSIYDQKNKNQCNDVRSNSYIPGHLSSPIYNNEVLFILENSKFYCQRHKLIKKKTVEEYNNIKSLIGNVNDPFHFIQEFLFSQPIIIKKDWKSNLFHIFNTAFDNLIIHTLTELNPVIKGDIVSSNDILNYFNKLRQTGRSQLYLLEKSYYNSIVAEIYKDNLCFKNTRLGYFLKFNNVHAERDLTILNHEKNPMLLPTNLLISVLDKLQARFWLLFYWLLSDLFNKYPGHSIFTTGTKLISIFESLRLKMPNKFHGFIGEWEALVKGYIIKLPDDLGFSHLYENQYTEMKDRLEMFQIPESILDDLIPHNPSDNKIRMFLELTGMTKIFGYPILDAPSLLNDIKKYGEGNEPLNFKTIDSALAIGKRDLLLQFFNKHERYPPIHECSKVLLKYISKNAPIPDRLFKEYHLWITVVFDKFLDFDYCADASELIKDSAASVPYSEWGTMFDICSFKNQNKSVPPSFFVKNRSSKRIVETFLQDIEGSVKKLIDERDQGVIHKDDKIAVECGKECEMKEDTGRAFTKQTYNQRLIQTAMEHSIAEVFFKYVPEQSMTDNEILNSQRIINQNKDMKTKSSVILNIDLKKWNLMFRHSVVYKFGEVIDQTFGFKNLYKDQHLWFINCPTFCNSRLCPPDSDNNGDPIFGEYYTDKHLGGFEGMNQKKWTWITICFLKLCLEEESINGTIMIQGDNILILIHFTKEELYDSVQKRESLLSTIEKRFSEINHKLKKMETWYSCNLHEYGKKCFYKYASVSQGTKKASKIIPDINDGLFSFDSSLSTINTITESIAREDYTSDVSFIINQACISHYLLRKQLCDITQLKIALFYPLDFGGLPLSTLHCHKIRGHDDKLTIWLSLLKTINEVDPLIYNTLLKVWDFGPKSPAKTSLDRSKLFEDIYCLAIESLPSISKKLKDYSVEYLQSDEVKNQTIRSLYDPDLSLSKEEIVTKIDSMEPMFLSLAHELFTNSNYGLFLRFRNKFTSISTITKMVQEKEGVDYIELISLNNKKYKNELSQRLKSKYNHHLTKKINISDCATSIAKMLRLASWGRELVNLTKPHHSSQFVIKKWDEISRSDRKKSIFISCSSDLVVNFNLLVTNMGMNNTFIGSNTIEKVSKPTIDISNKTSKHRAIRTLGKIRSYAKLSNKEGIESLATELILEKIDNQSVINIEDIDLWTPQVYGGNMLHRLISSSEKRYALLNNCHSKCSHIKQSSNNLSEMTLGGKDYSVFFQYVYLCNIQIMTQLSQMSLIGDILEYGCILSCFNCCTEELTEVDFDILDPSYNRTISKDIVLNSNLDSERLLLSNSHNKNDIIFSYHFHISSQLSKNIDHNFRNMYTSKNINIKLNKIVKESISINDFRVLDLRSVVLLTLLGSFHISDCLKEVSHYNISYSSDESLSYLCECIIESGRVNEFFSLFGDCGYVEHYTTIDSSKLSQFIIKSLRGILIKHLTYFINYFFSYTTVKNQFTGNIRYNLVLLLNSLGFQGKLNQKIKNYLGKEIIPLRQINLTWEVTMSLWKKLNRESLFQYYSPLWVTVTPAQNIEKISISSTFQLYKTFIKSKGGFIKSSAINYLSRTIGSISSAASKYVEIIFSLDLHHYLFQCTNGMIISIAEGSGGTITTLAQLFSNLKCGYNTLIQQGIDNRIDNLQNYPPAAIAQNIFNEKRFPYQKILAEGCTNILNQEFQIKLRSLLNLEKCFLLTMDAENVNHGSNQEFVESLIPIIVEYKIPITILKMFKKDQTLDKVSFIIDSYHQVIHCYYKPISSNPVSDEIFLIIIHKDLNDNSIIHNIEYCKLNEGLLNFIKSDGFPLNSADLQEYVSISKSRIEYFNNHIIPLNQGVYFKTPLTDLIKNIQACGITCNKVINDMISSYNVLNNLSPQTEWLYPLIRRSGIMKRLTQQLIDIISLIVFKSSGLVPGIIKLYKYKLILNESWRIKPLANNLLFYNENGNWFDDWAYSKFYLLEINRGSSNECNCTKTTNNLNLFLSSIILELKNKNIIPNNFSL